MAYENILLINLKKIPKKDALYEGEYKYKRANYSIQIYEDGVCVRKKTTTKAVKWNFAEVGGDLHDAIRKAHLLYALSVGKGLVVKEYRVSYAGGDFITISDSEKMFPFVFSILSGRDLLFENAGNKYNGVFHNREILEYFTTGNKSKEKEDKIAVAVCSFLQGRSRDFEVDRFMNYWTAVNSIYGFLNQEHKRVIDERVDAIPKEWLEEQHVTADNLKRLFSPYEEVMDDWNKLSVFMALIMKKRGLVYKGGKVRDKKAAWNEINKEYANPYKSFAEEYQDAEGKTRFSFGRLYELTTSGLEPDEIEFQDEKEKQDYAKLYEWGCRVENSPYVFLSLGKPYNQRNHYVHGSEVSVLFSDMYHLHLISCLNYFMDQLLSEFIPYLFDEEKLAELLSDVHTIIYEKNKNSNKVDGDAGLTFAQISKAGRKIANQHKTEWLAGKKL